ncbi:MAG: AsmA-like C-terminal region-containing protein [Myxococcota bacterium]
MRIWALLVVGFLLLAAGGVIALVNLNTYLNENKDWISKRVEAAVGRPVHFDKVGVSLWGGLGVRIESLRIADDPAFSKGDFLRAEDVRVRVRLLPALLGNYEVARVVLVAPSLTLIRNDAGLNLESLGGRGDTPQAPGGAGEEESAAFNAGAFLVAVVDIRDATLRYIDRRADPPVELLVDQLRFAASNVRLDGPIGLELEAAILGARTPNLRLTGHVGPIDIRAPRNSPLALQLALGPVDLDPLLRLEDVAQALPPEFEASGVFEAEVALEGQLEQLAIEASVDVSDSALRFAESFDKASGVPMQVAFKGSLAGQRLTIESLDLTLADARLAVTGSVTGGESARYDLHLVGESLPLAGWDALLPGLSGIELGGSAKLDLRARGETKAEGLPALEGSLALVGVEARVPDMPELSDFSTTVTIEGRDAFMPSTSFRLGDLPVELEVSIENLADPTVVASLSSPLLQPAALGFSSGENESGESQDETPDELRGVVLTATLRLPEGEPDAQVSLRSSGGRLQGIDYESLSAEFRLYKDRATIESLKLQAYQGELQVTGFYDMSEPERPTFDITSSLKDIRIDALLASQAPDAAQFLAGRANGKLTLKGAGSDWPSIREMLTGHGNLRIEEGVLKDVNLAEEVFSALTGVPGLSGLLSSDLRRKHPQLFGSGDTVFEAMGGDLQIAEGRARVRNLRLAANDYSVVARGSVGLDGKVDMKATFSASDALTASLVKKLSQMQYLKGKRGRIEIPFRIGGRLPDVKLKPDTQFVSKALQRALVDSVIENLLRASKPKPQPQPAPTAGTGEEPAEQTPEPPKTPAEVGRELLEKSLGDLLGR